MTRRAVLQTLVCGGLSGCASDYTPPTLRILGQLYQSVLQGTPTGYTKTPDQIRSSHFACMGAQIGDGPRAVMLLNAYDGDAQRWVSGDRITLKTRNGRLLESYGLPRDLRSADFVRTDPMAELQGRPAFNGLGTNWVMDLSKPDEFSVVARSKFLVVGAETITILDRNFQVVRVDETVSVDAWEWVSVNHYWMDAKTQFVWRSQQKFCKELPVLTLEILKPPEHAA